MKVEWKSVPDQKDHGKLEEHHEGQHHQDRMHRRVVGGEDSLQVEIS